MIAIMGGNVEANTTMDFNSVNTEYTVRPCPGPPHYKTKRKSKRRQKKHYSSHHGWKVVNIGRTCNKKRRR